MYRAFEGTFLKNTNYTLKKFFLSTGKSLDYVTSVDLWSDIIAMLGNVYCLFIVTKKKSF